MEVLRSYLLRRFENYQNVEVTLGTRTDWVCADYQTMNARKGQWFFVMPVAGKLFVQ